jgi:hypothetical protein
MLVRKVTIPALMAAGVFQMRRTILRLPDTRSLRPDTAQLLRPRQEGLQDMQPQPAPDLLLHPRPAIHSRPELKPYRRQEAVNKPVTNEAAPGVRPP